MCINCTVFMERRQEAEAEAKGYEESGQDHFQLLLTCHRAPLNHLLQESSLRHGQSREAASTERKHCVQRRESGVKLTAANRAAANS